MTAPREELLLHFTRDDPYNTYLTSLSQNVSYRVMTTHATGASSKTVVIDGFNQIVGTYFNPTSSKSKGLELISLRDGPLLKLSKWLSRSDWAHPIHTAIKFEHEGKTWRWSRHEKAGRRMMHLHINSKKVASFTDALRDTSTRVTRLLKTPSLSLLSPLSDAEMGNVIFSLIIALQLRTRELAAMRGIMQTEYRVAGIVNADKTRDDVAPPQYPMVVEYM